ncbi:MAG: response regulator transcription factor [Planctomycetes bacterium]|nr:response regulator transcription factor [Planctomycetota bacterium]MBL7042802.1 response regulator transcription factor [Pirellulaceae bacterium]
MQTDPTVFLVDDDAAALDSLKWLLETAGLDVETYNSAVEYLDAHDPQKPGCLVLDVCMPVMDGLDLQEKLVAIGERIPIIFVTGHGNVPSSVQAMKAGAIDFVEKPVDGPSILRLVERALEKDSQRRRQVADRAEIEARIERLSRREREVMELLYAGKSMKRIAAELGISVQTVAKHRAQILEKMEVDGVAELARILTTYQLQEP